MKIFFDFQLSQCQNLNCIAAMPVGCGWLCFKNRIAKARNEIAAALWLHSILNGGYHG
jgi:hypothetical protein